MLYERTKVAGMLEADDKLMREHGMELLGVVEDLRMGPAGPVPRGRATMSSATATPPGQGPSWDRARREDALAEKVTPERL